MDLPSPYLLASSWAPKEIDKLLSSIVRRQPGQAPPPGAVPISGRGAPKSMPAGGRGAGAAAAARAMAAVGNRSNGAGRGPTPPGGVDNRPKLRWDQTNDEVEIVIRVDPSEFGGKMKTSLSESYSCNVWEEAFLQGVSRTIRFGLIGFPWL